jgi:hypothetical protein
MHDFICVYDVLMFCTQVNTLYVCFLCHSEFVSTPARLKNFAWPQWYPKGRRFDTRRAYRKKCFSLSAWMHTQSNIKNTCQL